MATKSNARRIVAFGTLTTSWVGYPKSGASFRLIKGALFSVPLLSNGHADMGDPKEIEFGLIEKNAEKDALRIGIELQAKAEVFIRAESATPVRWLYCNCCGARTQGRQWHNRDTGWGMCSNCIAFVRRRSMPEEEIYDNYGIEGVHFSISEG